MKSRHVTPETLSRIREGLKRYAITHDQVAAEASKTSRRGSVGRTAVSHALAGDIPSANILDTARRLIRQARTRQGEAVPA